MSNEFDVGYKRPPKHTRFKLDRSGNPRGRPKGTKNLKSDLSEELQEQVLVREGSTEKQISKQRAMVKSLIAKAIKGDTRATTIIYTMMLRLLEVGDIDSTEAPLTDDERAVLATLEEQILRRVQQRSASGRDTKTSPETKERHNE
jgi:hypothetical protein